MEDDDGGRLKVCIDKRLIWLTLLVPLLWLLFPQAHAAEDTALRPNLATDPLIGDKAIEIVKGMQKLNPEVAGVYYVPSEEAAKRGFIFDDIPRDAIGPNHAQLTEKRMKNEGKFVKFNARQISYSLMETRDTSTRINYFPNKGAVMLNWTYSVEPGKWWWFER